MPHLAKGMRRAWTSRGLAALLCLLAVSATSRALEPLSPESAKALDQKLLSMAKTDSELMKNLQYLSDVIGPRLTGSENLKRANDWTAEVMKKYGLSNVHLEPYEIPAGWERGTMSFRLVEPNNGKQIIAAAMAWTPGTKGKLVGDVVFLKATTRDELNAYKGKLKNAIVMTRPPSNVAPIGETPPSPYFDTPAGGRRPGAAGAQGEQPRRGEGAPGARGEQPRRGEGAPGAQGEQPRRGPGAQGEQPPRRGPGGGGPRDFGQAMAFRREMAEFLRTEGAAVMLMDAGKPHGLLNMTGSWRGNDRVSAQEPLPTLFVAHEHYSMLYRLATRDGATTKAEIEITNRLIPGPHTVYNTVGEIVGSEKPDEIVVLGAHLDSWDLGQGTTDNGTGSSVVLETARILANCGVRPRRTIRFVLFTGEEQGLHGSKAYVQRHKDEMARTSMALVHDTGTGRVVGLGLQGRESVRKIFEKELESLKDVGLAEVNLRSMSGTDHLSFEAVDVPGFACRQDPAEYRLTHHSQSDTLDKARPDDLVQGAQVMSVIAMRVANLPEMLPRDKPAGAGGRGGFRRPPQGDTRPPAGEAKPEEKKEEKKPEPAKKEG